MVETNINKNTGAARIVLRPNNSASWQFNVKVVASLTLITLLVSSFFGLHGLWMIFPFAGLEIGFLTICLYLRLLANTNTEVITFDDVSVVIERGHYHAEKTWKYHRMWAKIIVIKPVIYGRPKQIYIRSHGKELELGSFLNKKDKERLINDLKGIIYT